MDDDYNVALGAAVICFARAEWGVVWSCERLKAGSLAQIRDRTAGGISKHFSSLVAQLPPGPEQMRLAAASAEFARLVLIRNGILHGKPGTTKAMQQRLFRDGKPWEIADLQQAADEFAACDIEINALFHGFLKSFSGLP